MFTGRKHFVKIKSANKKTGFEKSERFTFIIKMVAKVIGFL